MIKNEEKMLGEWFNEVDYEMSVDLSELIEDNFIVIGVTNDYGDEDKEEFEDEVRFSDFINDDGRLNMIIDSNLHTIISFTNDELERMRQLLIAADPVDLVLLHKINAAIKDYPF